MYWFRYFARNYATNLIYGMDNFSRNGWRYSFLDFRLIPIIYIISNALILLLVSVKNVGNKLNLEFCLELIQLCRIQCLHLSY